MPDSLSRFCDEPPPAALLAGITQFNQGEYFECHETLEAIWMREPRDIRRLYQGILQIGVGFYHLQRGNYRGTLNLLASGVAYLEPFAPICMGVVLDPLLDATRAIRRAVLAGGPAGLHEVDPTRLPRITVHAPKIGAPPVPPPTLPATAPGHW